MGPQTRQSNPIIESKIKLMKGKALRKHSLHEKTAASVLLKLFISSNECCHTTDAPQRMSGTPFSNVNNIHVHSMIPEDQKNMTSISTMSLHHIKQRFVYLLILLNYIHNINHVYARPILLFLITIIKIWGKNGSQILSTRKTTQNG